MIHDSLNSAVTESLKNAISFHKRCKRVPKARKWLRNTMSPWTLQWGPRSFYGKQSVLTDISTASTSCPGFRKIRAFVFPSLLSLCCRPDYRWVGKKECGKIEVTKGKRGTRAFTVGHEKRVEGRGLTKSWGKRREVVFVHEKGWRESGA